jgi:hypothetical protein
VIEYLHFLAENRKVEIKWSDSDAWRSTNPWKELKYLHVDCSKELFGLIMIHDRNIPEYLWLVPSPWMQGFFKNSSAGWGIRKTRGPYWVHGEMTDVLEWCCIGLRVFFPRNVLYFSTPRTAFRAFYETDFWYTAFKLYCIAR